MNNMHSVWHRLVTLPPKPPAIPPASYRHTYWADSQLLYVWQTTPRGWACFSPPRVCYNTILNCWRCSHPDGKGSFSFLGSLLHPKMHSDKNKRREAALSTNKQLRDTFYTWVEFRLLSLPQFTSNGDFLEFQPYRRAGLAGLWVCINIQNFPFICIYKTTVCFCWYWAQHALKKKKSPRGDTTLLLYLWEHLVSKTGFFFTPFKGFKNIPNEESRITF